MENKKNKWKAFGFFAFAVIIIFITVLAGYKLGIKRGVNAGVDCIRLESYAIKNHIIPEKYMELDSVKLFNAYCQTLKEKVTEYKLANPSEVS